ncbi:enoyl-CoA hydratase/isomerase family protein [Salinibacillus xinjiangensis]|uniref:Enoyl-CoA hydratase/isomerase family protein n=1 Tax=Salinibacillus xinjiangensis TaxID=1229268 RepID=A0A6G1X6M2_9BACI|nr:enoyl-CoA hydratase/isomerase family protein [Salinibacillus xinjiangensis]MRG86530.1 enoyl-CoA hydratase/isomerase family protein [Salinibacillus xinjiangensis]
MSYQTIEIEYRDKGVTWILVDHPPVNAIGEELMQDLDQAAEELTDDSNVRVVVITSRHPKIFLAGADLKGAMQNSSSDSNGEENIIEKQSARMQACFHRFATMPKPVIAAINGHALGGGCELAMACDFRLMSKGRIGLTELTLGLIPGAGGTQRMTQLLGRSKATELIFTAKQLEAKEAEDIGLVNRAVSEEQLEPEVTAFAEQLAEGAVHAMGLAKRAINAAEQPIAEGLKTEAKAFADTFLTDEPSIGLAAFFQKEKPNFLK